MRARITEKTPPLTSSAVSCGSVHGLCDRLRTAVIQERGQDAEHALLAAKRGGSVYRGAEEQETPPPGLVI